MDSSIIFYWWIRPPFSGRFYLPFSFGIRPLLHCGFVLCFYVRYQRGLSRRPLCLIGSPGLILIMLILDSSTVSWYFLCHIFRDSSFNSLLIIISLNSLRGSPFSYVHARIFGRLNLGCSVCLNCFQLTC